MSNILITSYDNFSLLAHKPKGTEAKNHITYISNISNKYKFPGIKNPSFILKHPFQNYYYVCNESIFNGSISTYCIENDKLKIINSISSLGKSSCYLCFDINIKHIININYWDSSITVHPIKNYIIEDAIQAIRPRIPNNINVIGDHLENRQNTSHHHSCVFYKDKLFVPDLGTDKIDIFKYKDGNLIFNNFFQLKKGSGPRYSIIKNNYLYVINELSSSIDIIELDTVPKIIIQNIKTIPTNFSDKNTCGSLQIHPNKNFIYASNRGHDSIAVFKINENYTLSLINIYKTLGKTPRHFSINNTGTELYVANQDSDNIVVFNIKNDGSIVYNNKIKCDSPNFVIEI